MNDKIKSESVKQMMETRQATMTEPTMKLFQPAINQTAYLKAGFYGFAGSGKTFTATLIALGIMGRLKSRKPVAFFDTETGSDWVIPKFKAVGLDLVVVKRRAFKDLLEAVKEAEQYCDVLIIDSISHVWNELLSTYMREKNKKRLDFPDWNVLKPQWQQFTDLYLNSRLHILMCGRAGNIWDFVDHGADFKDQGEEKRYELVKTGTKMKAETDMGYEPSLLIEMERIKKEGGRGWIHRATVLKDRSDLLDGAQFDDPGFESFTPVFAYLNIGGEHIGMDSSSTSAALFDKDTKQFDWQKEQTQRTICLEEIQNEMVTVFPAGLGIDKQMKNLIIEAVFETKSWEKIQGLPLADLENGLHVVRDILLSPEALQRFRQQAEKLTQAAKGKDAG